MEKVIVALDVDNEDQALALINELSPPIGFFKVGLELYTSQGNRLVKKIKERNLNVFLDLKLHDIPNTVAKTVAIIAKLKPDFITVHTLGGKEMLKAAVDSAKDVYPDIKVLGVTVLTSIDQQILKEIGISQNIKTLVNRLGRLAYDSGCDGLVCSPFELKILRKIFPRHFLLVAPGIRLSSEKANDQKRISTPKMAIEYGANYLVIGRSITENKQPKKVLEQLFR